MPKEHEDYRNYLELISEEVGKNVLMVGDVMKVTGKSRNFVKKHIMPECNNIGACTLARMMCNGF